MESEEHIDTYILLLESKSCSLFHICVDLLRRKHYSNPLDKSKNLHVNAVLLANT